MRLEVLPVTGIGEVAEGDDLVGLIVTAAPWLRDDDILVVTSKIVSKAEGRLVKLPADEVARHAAREDALAAETARLVAQRGPTRIVQTRHGFVMAAAGIDASNVDADRLVLLPVDPDGSARALRSAFHQRYGLDVVVIISDTMGRPWRNGLTDVALGVAGMDPVRDHRGQRDPYGNELRLTEMAVVDELAAAAELVKGKCDQVPVAVVRGYSRGTGSDDGRGAVALVRDAELDLFSLGTAEARALGLRTAATLADLDRPEADGPGGVAGPGRPDGPGSPGSPADPTVGRAVDPAAVDRAVATVITVVATGTTFIPLLGEAWRRATTSPPDIPPAAGLIRCELADPADPTALVRFGADVHRLRAALAAEGISATVVLPPEERGRVALVVI